MHTRWGTPFSAEVRKFEPITQESCVFFEDHALFDDEEVQVQSVDAGKRIADALGHNRAIILRNHGLLTVGDSVAEAVGSFVQMERVAEAHMKAREAVPISAEAARFAKADLVRYGAGRVSFAAMVARHIGDPSCVLKPRAESRQRARARTTSSQEEPWSWSRSAIVAPGIDAQEYGQRAGKLFEIVAAMPGFRSIRDYESEDGERLSVIEFDSHESLAAWRDHAEHRVAQELGKQSYYAEYHLQICELVRESHKERAAVRSRAPGSTPSPRDRCPA